MSIMRSTGVRSTFASFIEVTLFFCVLSVAYLVVCFAAYHVIAQPLAKGGRAAELAQAVDRTRSVATTMVDARREMIDKAESADESPAGIADAKRAKRLAEQTAKDAQHDISEAARLMLADSSKASGDLDSNAANILTAAEAMNAAITEAVDMTTAAAEPDEQDEEASDDQPAAEAAPQPADEAPDQPGPDASDVTADEATDEPSDEESEDEPRQPTPPPVHLGQSVVDLVAKVDTLTNLADVFVTSANGAKTEIEKLTKDGEKAATHPVRVAAGAIFPDDIADIAAATTTAAIEIAVPDLSADDVAAISEAITQAVTASLAETGEKPDDKPPATDAAVTDAVNAALDELTELGEDESLAVAADAAAIADATTKAVKTSLDEVGRAPEKKIPRIIETVKEAARTALDDVAGIEDADFLAVAEAAEQALRHALDAATLAAAPTGDKGQTPPWAEQLVQRFAADRLKAADILTGSLEETTAAIVAVESAAADVLAATRVARTRLATAPWSHEAEAFIDRVDQVEAVADQFLVDARLLQERLTIDEPIDEADQVAATAQIEDLAAKMIADAKAIAENLPPAAWAGQEQVTALIEQIAETLDKVISDAQALSDNYANPPAEPTTTPLPGESPNDTARRLAERARQQAKLDALSYEDLARLVTGALPGQQDQLRPRRRLGVLAIQLHSAAKQIVFDCRSAREDIQENRAQQAKDLVNLIWRIDRRAKQILRRSRAALATADAAGRGQVTPGQGRWDSFQQGLGEVRMRRVLQSNFPLINFSELLGSLPWWMWVLEGLVYLLILTVYWAPSEDAAVNLCELRAFAFFAGIAVVSALVALQAQGQYITRVIRLFLDILQRGG